MTVSRGSWYVIKGDRHVKRSVVKGTSSSSSSTAGAEKPDRLPSLSVRDRNWSVPWSSRNAALSQAAQFGQWYRCRASRARFQARGNASRRCLVRRGWCTYKRLPVGCRVWRSLACCFAITVCVVAIDSCHYDTDQEFKYTVSCLNENPVVQQSDECRKSF